MNEPITLDYTLTTAEERVASLSSLNLDSQSEAMLENCANYILHAADKSLANHAPQNSHHNKYNLELNENIPEPQPVQPRAGSNAYLYPTIPVPWDSPHLRDLAEDIDKLELAAQQAEGKQLYLYNKWILELRMDAKARIPNAHTIPTVSDFTPPTEIDMEQAGLDWTNSFHIKHVVRYYSDLKQSEHSNLLMCHFEKLVDNAGLLPWQMHILVRYIDKAHSITIAREVAEQFDIMLQPGYTSKVMRQIYRAIAEEGEKVELMRTTPPSEWRLCPRCGNRYPDNFHWWRKGQRMCKNCLREREQEKGEQEQ